MRIEFTENGLEDYNYWAINDKKKFKRLIKVIENIIRTPFQGIGKPEPLKKNLKGLWSRRLDIEHRIVYIVEDNKIVILQCRYHYD